MSTPCTSGKHHWIDTVSATRCCAPGWTRPLRAPGEHIEGDADDGRIMLDGGWLRVWHYDDDQVAADRIASSLRARVST